MEVLEVRSAELSNSEVEMFLKDMDAHRREDLASSQKGSEYQDLLTVEFEVLQYLSKSPSSNQTMEEVSKYMKSINKFHLTKGEKLQMVNLKPGSLVELYLVIEECETRFSQEQLEEMIQITQEIWPPPETEEVEEEAAE
ncbi:hypothetical protein HK102_005109 [Quaeritorhiza haematococci]|nr:hypothetical protein HK102_005109 [Quaeritorhiza haematococci]